MPGRVTERGRSRSPTRIAGGRPLVCLLRSRNDGVVPVFFLNRGKPTRLPVRSPRRESARRQRPTEVDGGFLEHLLAHFGPPRQAVHPDFGDTIGVDTEDSAGRLGLLPHVERVDQIKPRPRHPGIRIGLALSELDLDDS